MNKWNLIIDVALCNNCNNCVLSSKDEYVGNDFPGYSAPHARQGVGVIHVDRTVRGTGAQVDVAYLPRLCNHCDNAPCIKASNGAIRKREDGIVIIDPIKAKGRRDLVDSCPYGAIVWNEEQQLPQNWIFDAHLLDAGWQAPRPANVCPTQAIKAIKVSDAAMVERTKHDDLRVLMPELNTMPRVYYRNLHRVDRCFIAGTVLFDNGDQFDCCEGATVTLRQPAAQLGSTRTNAFGEFKFDAIVRGSGEYRIDIDHPQYGRATTHTTVGQASCTLGLIRLQRR